MNLRHINTTYGRRTGTTRVKTSERPMQATFKRWWQTRMRNKSRNQKWAQIRGLNDKRKCGNEIANKYATKRKKRLKKERSDHWYRNAQTTPNEKCMLQWRAPDCTIWMRYIWAASRFSRRRTCHSNSPNAWMSEMTLNYVQNLSLWLILDARLGFFCSAILSCLTFEPHTSTPRFAISRLDLC